MPSARLHIEGNPLLIINKFPWHWLLINLLFYSSNYFCLFKLTVSFPHLPWVSCRRCCMANMTFLCSQVPYRLCSVHELQYPSQPLPRSDLPLHGSVFHSDYGIYSSRHPRCSLLKKYQENMGFPVSSPGKLSKATRNPPHNSQMVPVLPTGNGVT